MSRSEAPDGEMKAKLRSGLESKGEAHLLQRATLDWQEPIALSVRRLMTVRDLEALVLMGPPQIMTAEGRLAAHDRDVSAEERSLYLKLMDAIDPPSIVLDDLAVTARDEPPRVAPLATRGARLHVEEDAAAVR